MYHTRRFIFIQEHGCCHLFLYVTAEEYLQGYKRQQWHNKQLAMWQREVLLVSRCNLDKFSKGEYACSLAFTPRCTFIYKKHYLICMFRGVYPAWHH